MMKRQGSMILLSVVAGMLWLVGCQPVPESIRRGVSAPLVRTEAPQSAAASPNATPCPYQVHPAGTQPEPARADKQPAPLIPQTTKHIQTTLTAQGRSIVVDAVASIPQVSSLPVLRAEYIPTPEERTFQDIVTNGFIPSAQAHLLTAEEIVKRTAINRISIAFLPGMVNMRCLVLPPHF